jgi:hypothetical protein
MFQHEADKDMVERFVFEGEVEYIGPLKNDIFYVRFFILFSASSRDSSEISIDVKLQPGL